VKIVSAVDTFSLKHSKRNSRRTFWGEMELSQVQAQRVIHRKAHVVVGKALLKDWSRYSKKRLTVDDRKPGQGKGRGVHHFQATGRGGGGQSSEKGIVEK